VSVSKECILCLLAIQYDWLIMLLTWTELTQVVEQGEHIASDSKTRFNDWLKMMLTS
jgi:hypothetical protein